MQTREQKIAELRRRDKIAKLRARDAERAQGGGAAPQPEAKSDSYYIDGAMNAVKDTAKGAVDLAKGFNIGESIPIVGPAVGKAADYASAALSAPFSDKTVGELYEQNQQRANAQDADFAQRFPKAQFAKDVAGSAMLPGPKGLQAADGAGKIARAGVGAANLGLRTGQAALESGVDAALRRQDAGESAETAAQWSAGLQLAPKVLGPLAKGVAYATSGLKPSTIDAYRALPDERRYMSEEQRTADLTRDASEIDRKGREAKVRADQSFAMKKDEALARESQDIDAINRKKDKTKESQLTEADVLQRGAADSFVESLKGARKKVSEGSSKAYDVAEKSDVKLNIPRLKGYLSYRMNQMKIRGVAPDDASFKTLERYYGRLEDFGKKPLSGEESKSFLSWLDRDAEDAFANKRNPGAYNAPEEKALMEIRGKVSDNLKKDPEYASAMEPVARQTRALNDARDQFGSDGDSVYKAMKKFREMQNQDKAQVLQNYEQEFGGNFTRQLDEADAIRKTDFEELFAPDIQRVKEGTSQQLEGLDKIRGRRRMEANRQIDLVKGLTTEKGAVGKLRRYGGNPERNFPDGNQLKSLARERGLPEDNYTKMAEDNALINAMSGSYQRGSRNVNLGAFSVGGLANLAGDKAGKLGQLGGAALGGMADLVGAKPAKILVDFLDSPTNSKLTQKLGPTKGAAIERVYNRMRDRGPQAIAMTHKLYMQRDPEYRAIFEQEGEDE